MNRSVRPSYDSTDKSITTSIFKFFRHLKQSINHI